MKLTIVVPDNSVTIDGVSYTTDCSSLVGIHAIQWSDDTGTGHVEFVENTDGTKPKPSMLKGLSSNIQAIVTAAQTPVLIDPAVQAQNDAIKARIDSFVADANFQDLITRLRNANASQISNYVDNSVTNLSTARDLLKKILLVLGTVV